MQSNDRLTGISKWLVLAALALATPLAAQNLVSVNPPNGTTDFDVSSPIVFTFDETMDDATLIMTEAGGFFDGSIVWTGLDPLNFTPVWTANNTVLTLNYDGGLPGETTIAWEINPEGALFMLRSDEFQLPTPNTAGSFTTGPGGCNPNLVPDSFGQVFLSKSVSYSQTGQTVPVLNPEEPPVFSSSIQSPDSDGVTAATLQPPTGEPISYTGGFGQLFIFGEFESQAAMDAVWTAGTYSISMDREIAPTPTEVSMSMPVDYPPVPEVQNYVALQDVAAGQDFPIQWNTFTGAVDPDFIQLTITDDQDNIVLELPNPCGDIDLSHSDTSIVIPANTLEAGRIYNARLAFVKAFFLSTDNPAEFLSFGSIANSTAFTINTGSTVVVQPSITAPVLDQGVFSFTINDLEIGVTYRVQESATLEPGSWSNVDPAIIPSTTSQDFLTPALTEENRYFRVIRP